MDDQRRQPRNADLAMRLSAMREEMERAIDELDTGNAEAALDRLEAALRDEGGSADDRLGAGRRGE